MKQQVAQDFKGACGYSDTIIYMKDDQDNKEHCFWIACVSLFTIYIFCMVLVPTFSNWNQKSTWQEVQQVWDRWQTFNSSMIALLASAIAIYSTIYKDRAEKKRNFIAERAYLPHALSDFSTYIQDCAKICVSILEEVQKNQDIDFLSEVKINSSPPVLSGESLQAAKSCIKYAENNESQRLTKILQELQIVSSRINGYLSPLDGETVSHKSVLRRLYYFAEVLDLIHNTFDFARGGNLTEYTKPDEDENKSTCMHYFNMNFWHFRESIPPSNFHQ